MLFVKIYRYFAHHKPFMWFVLVLSVLLMGFLSTKLTMQMDITSFLPESEETQMVFNNLKVADRIVVMINTEEAETYELIDVAEQFKEKLWAASDSAHILSLNTTIDTEGYDNTVNFIYNNLPLYLEDKDYQALDSLLTAENCNEVMKENYSKLTSAMGVGVKKILLKDPLWIGSKTLLNLSKLNAYDNYTIFEDYLFSNDYKTLFVFLESADGANASDINEELTTSLENVIASLNTELSNIEITYFGTPAVAAYNVRQVYKDLILTITIALVTITLLISLVYRNKRTIILLITPILYGFLFSLAFIYLVKGSISLIAIGLGSIILGVALSYSIHVLSHSFYSADTEKLIKELAYPLTVGSITTIGAFVGLTFTNSALLQDFGIFASTNILGTCIFCLIFLPHFLKKETAESSTIGIRVINKINSYPYDKNKFIIAALIIATTIGLFTYQNVGFNSDMMDLNFMPEHLHKSQLELEQKTSSDEIILAISHASTLDSAIVKYKQVKSITASLLTDSVISKSTSVADFIFTQDEQIEKINKWNSYWTAEKKACAKQIINEAAANNNFKENTFSEFINIINKEYKPQNMLDSMGETLFATFIESNNNINLFTTHIFFKDENNKAEVYPLLTNLASVIDRSYFIGTMAEDITDNFNLILGISSALIFIVLLISYGRIELALLAFLPMCISWIIILGFMSILNVEFNIISIILSTFIFGIGDDFSIFILDGLINDYKHKKRMLIMHKTAIFFSVLMIILGMGVLVFAQHPAIHSLGVVSLLGIVVVMLVSYTIQPLLFRIFISNEAEKAGLPHTIGSLLRTIVVFLTVGTGCIMLPLVMFLSLLLPVKFNTKRYIFRRLLAFFAQTTMTLAFGVKLKINRNGEDFKKPAIIVANHQSLVDLLMVFSINPSVVVVTQGWVFKSPLFGLIVRIAGYLPANSGIENIDEKVKETLDKGLSVLIFPEGTRSKDLKVHRFHKGAFYLAEKYKVDIIPAVLYGSGMIFSKVQPQYVAPGIMQMDILPRIAPEDNTYGATYQERTKNVRNYLNSYLQTMRSRYDTPQNKYFKSALIKQYLFKDRDTEFSVYFNCLKHNWYNDIVSQVPRNATVLDINCGYGDLALMLSITSDERKVYAYSASEEEYSIAQNSVLGRKVNFFAELSAIDELPELDVIVYQAKASELTLEDNILLEKFKKRLSPSGNIVIKYH